MDDVERISFAEKLDGWLRQRFAIDASAKKITSLTRVGNLDFRYDGAGGMYLRLWPAIDREDYWPKNTLVIASLEFADTRAGHGRALLEFFVSQAKFYGYDKIALEHTHDGDDIQGFAKKFGFEYAWPGVERPQRNWIAPVERVAERLDRQAVSP
jgi:ribosomal protein S18 acetylase RimI-like enzyme